MSCKRFIMYENKIDSDITTKAIDELLSSYLGINLKFPSRMFISQMTNLEKENLYQWANQLEKFCLHGVVLSENDQRVIHFHNSQDLQSLEEADSDFMFLQLQADPALTALWLYEFYCRENHIIQQFDSVKLKALLRKAYKSSDVVAKTHFLKIAIEKNFFVVCSLICLVFLLVSELALVCFVFGVCAFMGLFMHFFLAQRILEEEMVNICLDTLGGVGEDDIIKSVIISNSILKKQINQFVPLINV